MLTSGSHNMGLLETPSILTGISTLNLFPNSKNAFNGTNGFLPQSQSQPQTYQTFGQNNHSVVSNGELINFSICLCLKVNTIIVIVTEISCTICRNWGLVRKVWTIIKAVEVKLNRLKISCN